jgi:hypothetical protein
LILDNSLRAINYFSSSDKEQQQQQQSKTNLMLNPYIKQVFYIMDPVSLDEIREIHELLSNTKFSFDFRNIHVIYHVVQGIENQSNLIFAIRG